MKEICCRIGFIINKQINCYNFDNQLCNNFWKRGSESRMRVLRAAYELPVVENINPTIHSTFD